MIYILSGNDTKKKKISLKKLCKDSLPISIPSAELSRETIFSQAGSNSLFGESLVVVLDNIINENNINLSPEDLLALKNSKTTFVFLEDKLLAPDIKKYKKYATIEDFSKEEGKKQPKMNVFNIAEAFSRKDKIGTWVLYGEAIRNGSSPEEISGILFWKVKTMILNGSKFFSKDELVHLSSELVSIYHDSHMGKCDFTIGLEQFILSSLSK